MSEKKSAITFAQGCTYVDDAPKERICSTICITVEIGL